MHTRGASNTSNIISIIHSKQCVTPRNRHCVPRQRPEHNTMPVLLLEQCRQRLSLNCNVHGRHNHQPNLESPTLKFLTCFRTMVSQCLMTHLQSWYSPGLSNYSSMSSVSQTNTVATRDENVLDLAWTVGESSVEKPSCDLFDVATLFSAWNKEMYAFECGVTHDVQQMQQMIPFITCEIAFR